MKASIFNIFFAESEKNLLEKLIFYIIIGFFFVFYAACANAQIHLVAAENIYGEVAKEIAGTHADVISLLNNPAQDPHLFTATPHTARVISQADIVVYNGADYDPWLLPLLTTKGKKNRIIINVAALMHIKSGDNPHIWYLPMTMPVFAKALTDTFIQVDPVNRIDYQNRLAQFNQSYQSVFTTVLQLKRKYQNLPVIATEPVFGYMAESIGFIMHAQAFQINVMNDVPPTISQIKSFEDDLTHHAVMLLIYNNQVMNPLTENMKTLAKKNNIAVFGISEMLPPNISFVQWILAELNNLDEILKNRKRTTA